MLLKIIQPDCTRTDERGSLTQLVREGYKQINVVTSKAGTFRGGHYHALNREAFYIISGKTSVTVKKDGIKETYDFTAGDMFEIPPGVTHDFNYGDNTVLIGMYDIGVETCGANGDYYVTDIIDVTDRNTLESPQMLKVCKLLNGAKQ